MATILEFRPGSSSRTGGYSEGDAAVGAAAHRAATAELIFFPGVRYERHVDVEQPSPKRAKRRHHEVLELPDLD